MVNQYKLQVRRRKIVELRAKGLTVPEIVQQLSSEKDSSGHTFKVSQRTVFYDLSSEQAELLLSSLTDELVRLQIKDLEKAELPLKLKYRDRLLDHMIPKREIIKQEIKQQIVETENASHLRDFTEEEREEIRKTGRILLHNRPRPPGSPDLQ